MMHTISISREEDTASFVARRGQEERVGRDVGAGRHARHSDSRRGLDPLRVSVCIYLRFCTHAYNLCIYDTSDNCD